MSQTKHDIVLATIKRKVGKHRDRIGEVYRKYQTMFIFDNGVIDIDAELFEEFCMACGFESDDVIGLVFAIKEFTEKRISINRVPAARPEDIAAFEYHIAKAVKDAHSNE